MSPRMRCTDSLPSGSRRTVISSPHVASHSGTRPERGAGGCSDAAVGGHRPMFADHLASSPTPSPPRPTTPTSPQAQPHPPHPSPPHSEPGYRRAGMRRLLPDASSDVTIEEAYSGPARKPRRSTVGRSVHGGLDRRIDRRRRRIGRPVERQRLGGDAATAGARRRDHRRSRARSRAEGYGPPRRAGLRIGVVTASGHIDLTIPLFTSGAGFVITTEAADVPAGVDVIRAGTDAVDLAAAIGSLDEVCDDPRFVQAEGGPTLNGCAVRRRRRSTRST